MNRNSALILLISFLYSPWVLCQGSADQAMETGHPGTVQSVADTYLKKLTSLEQFNGVVLLRKNNEILLRKAYTFSGDTASTLYVTPECQFDLRSVAKLFARAGILQLEREGLLSRKDTIGTYLPGFPNAGRITIQNLMDHSSGLPREFNDSIENTLELTPEEILQLAAREPLEFEPGSRQQYSNVGYQLLYSIIGSRCEGSFSSCMAERFFRPLGMSHTGGNFDKDLSHLSRYAYGHYRDPDNVLQVVDSFPPDDMMMGNLHSTVDDLDRFLSALDDELYATLRQDQRISHAGGTRGKRAYVERNYKEDYTMVFLANYDGIPFEQLVSDLGKILSGQPVRMPERVQRQTTEVAPEVLRAYQGTYDLVEAGHLVLTIKMERDSLWVYQNGQNNGVLYPESETVFFSDPTSEESLEFVKDENGEYQIFLDFQGVRWKGIRVGE